MKKSDPTGGLGRCCPCLMRSQPYFHYFSLQTPASGRLIDERLSNFQSDFLKLGERLDLCFARRTQHRTRVLAAYAKALRQGRAHRHSIRPRSQLQFCPSSHRLGKEHPGASSWRKESLGKYSYCPVYIGSNELSWQEIPEGI